MRHPSTPTKRQREVLRLVALGYTYQGIAERLGIEFATTKTHVYQASERIGATCPTHAACIAVARGWITIDD